MPVIATARQRGCRCKTRCDSGWQAVCPSKDEEYGAEA